jgi:hypothetical protein
MIYLIFHCILLLCILYISVMYIYILEYPLFVYIIKFMYKNHFRIVFYETKFTFLLSKYLPFNPLIIWDYNVSYCIIICYLTPFLLFCVVVCRSLSLCSFSFGNIFVCLSSINGFWLPLWYLQISSYLCTKTV